MDVILEGGVWSLRDGRSIRAFQDRWVTSIPGNRLQARETTDSRTEGDRLAQWIDHDHRSWNAKVVRQIVLTHQVDNVLNTMLPLNAREDIKTAYQQIRWPYTKDGCVLVKTAYQQMRDRKRTVEVVNATHHNLYL